MATKKPYTFSINSEIRKEFKVQTAINEAEMSETIESFMDNYNKTSIRLRNEKNKELNNV